MFIKTLSLAAIITISLNAKIIEQEYRNAADSGYSSASDISNKVGGDLQGMVVAPLTQGQDFTTMDGKTKFQARVTCENAQVSYMKIDYATTSGNAIQVTIDLDRDFDGTKEYHFKSGVSFNSVCTQGFLSGNIGYKLGYNTTNGFTLTETMSDNVGNCFCIDSKCNSLSVSNKKGVLEQIASLAYPLVVGANANAVITKVAANDNYFEYYGQKTGDCDTGGNSSGNVFSGYSNLSNQGSLPEFDYSSPPSADGAMATEASNKNSAYSGLINSSKNYNANYKDMKSRVSDGLTTSARVQQDVKANNKNAATMADMTVTLYDYDGSIQTLYTNVNTDTGIDKQLYCEVSWDEISNDVFSDGTTRNTSTNSNSIEQYDIRPCTNNTICPVDTSKGERIEKACGKVNGIARAAAAAAIIDQIGDEIICGSI